MRTVLKTKVVAWVFVALVVSLAWLIDSFVPFVTAMKQRLAETPNKTFDVVFGVINFEYVVVARFLGPWAPAPDSLAGVLLKMGLAFAPMIGAALLIRQVAVWVLDHHHRHPASWICSECRAENHQLCRGALLFMSHASGGAQPCHCEHCALERLTSVP